MKLSLYEASSPEWIQQLTQSLDVLRQLDQTTLFPQHFLQVTLPRIGGYLVVSHIDGRVDGIGFLFPRAHKDGSAVEPKGTIARQRLFTLRYHPITQRSPSIEQARLLTERIAAHLPDANIIYYEPTGPHTYEATYHSLGDINIGRPSEHEAIRIRQLQAEIWGSPPESLYPVDIHSTEFQSGTSLVARVNGALAGFLLGFYSFEADPLPDDWQQRFRGALRLESQAMGVLAQFRGMRIGNLLKKFQADQAWQEQIGIVHWTADPLQYANASLNFGLLRALSYEFHPDYYPFRNQLNRVAASRLGVRWLVGSSRVQEVPSFGSKANVLDVGRNPSVCRVNHGPDHLIFDAQTPMIAIEVPASWTEMQRTDIDLAMRWRTATDQLFASYLGNAGGRYVITGVGASEDRRFLLAEFVDDQLWNRLGNG